MREKDYMVKNTMVFILSGPNTEYLECLSKPLKNGHFYHLHIIVATVDKLDFVIFENLQKMTEIVKCRISIHFLPWVITANPNLKVIDDIMWAYDNYSILGYTEKDGLTIGNSENKYTFQSTIDGEIFVHHVKGNGTVHDDVIKISDEYMFNTPKYDFNYVRKNIVCPLGDRMIYVVNTMNEIAVPIQCLHPDRFEEPSIKVINVNVEDISYKTINNLFVLLTTELYAEAMVVVHYNRDLCTPLWKNIYRMLGKAIINFVKFIREETITYYDYEKLKHRTAVAILMEEDCFIDICSIKTGKDQSTAVKFILRPVGSCLDIDAYQYPMIDTKKPNSKKLLLSDKKIFEQIPLI